MNGIYRNVVTIRVTDEVRDAIETLAAAERRTVANVARLLLEHGLFHRNGVETSRRRA